MRNSLAAIESIILLETVRCLETKGHSSVRLFAVLHSSGFRQATISYKLSRSNLYRFEKGEGADLQVSSESGVGEAAGKSLLPGGIEDALREIIGNLRLVASHFRKCVLESLVLAVGNHLANLSAHSGIGEFLLTTLILLHEFHNMVAVTALDDR